MFVLLGTVFAASLLGSLHCVGMCGPFALIAAAEPQRRKSAIVPTFAYSFGRLITYSAVGAIFGMLGMALNAGTSFTDWQQSATLVAGLVMVLVGLIALARCLGWRITLPRVFSPVQRVLHSAFKRTKELPPATRALTIGLLTSLMPCGWLYTFAITAAGTGSPLWGAVLMATFWAGTVPIMVTLMLGFDRIGTSIQKHIPATMAVLVIGVGLFTIAFRAPVALAGEQFQVVDDQEQLVQQVRSVDQEQLPCCQSGRGDE